MSRPGPAADGDALLAVQGLGCRVEGRWLVQDIDLSVGPGEVVGLLGANGAGKTTIFSLIAGLRRAQAGSIHLVGQPVTHLPLWQRARRGLGYLPQELALFEHMSAQQNLQAVAELMPALGSHSAAARRARVEDVLAQLELGPLATRPASALSGGERRRLSMARTLLAAPSLLMLDEPMAGVDPIAVADIGRTLARLSAAGVGVLMTDHNVEATLGACHRAYLLVDGRIWASGTPAQLVGDRRAQERYFGRNFRLR